MVFSLCRKALCKARDVFALVLLAMFFCANATAARFPNAIEKKIVLSGQDAVAIAELIGLSAKNKPELRLPLGPNDSWAVYLLKDDTPRKLLNSDDGMPERFNTITFSPSPSPSLTISPFWLDQGTALPNPEPGVYSFSSTSFPFADVERNSWGRQVTSAERTSWGPLVNAMKNIKAVDWKGGYRKAERGFHFADGAELLIQLWTNDENEYSVTVLVQHLPKE